MKSTGGLHSISRRVAASLAIMIALVSAVMVAFMYFYASRAASADLERKADETLLYLTGTLELPLWNDDKETAKLIAKTVFQNDLIATLTISDSFGNTFISMSKDTEAEKVERAGEVTHRGMSVGSIKLSLTTRIHSERTRELLGSFAFALSLIVVCLMLLTSLVVRTLLRQPLGDLNRIVDAYSEGIYEPASAPMSCLEFRAVGEVLAKMGGKISDQLEKLVERTKALERENEERIRAEMAAAESQKLLQSLTDNSSSLIYACDPQGRFLFVNQRFANLFGLPRESLIGKTREAIMPAEIAAAHRNSDLLVIETQKPIMTEEEGDEPDGKHTYLAVKFPIVDPQGNAPGIGGISTDITDRKQSELALRDSRQRLDNIVANSPGAIYRCFNDPQWTMEFLSAAITRITGYPATDFLQNRVRSYASVIHPDDRRAVTDAVSDALPRKSHYEMDYRLIASDGSTRWVHEQGQGVFALDGQLLCLDGVIFDITEQKAAQEEVGKLNRELEHRVAERTAELRAANKELESFAYTISHDLRAPLRHIDGFLDLLKARTAATLDGTSRHYMDTISYAAKRMGAMVDDLLAFLRMGRREMTWERVDLGILLRDVVSEFEAVTTGRDIDWRVGELPVVTGDRAMLRMVLVNLISNALKFTQKCEKAEIEIGSLPDQEAQACVFVRDNGVGFDMQYAHKLFGVFQRLHGNDEFEGTGIGLANVRRIISRHGGRTWAEGKVDSGATFLFSLPHSNGRQT
jgi:PAS domain S-box-containing protein